MHQEHRQDNERPAGTGGETRPERASFRKETPDALRDRLSPIAFHVTQEGGTEPPFDNDYFDQFGRGIYVDVTTGQPLFSSADKFDARCGWPAFARPIEEDLIDERADHSFGMTRVEVRSALGDAHLGHVFRDGPRDRGGLRYCINSAALRFIAYEEMEREGYGAYMDQA